MLTHKPQVLHRIFTERANAGDVEGALSLYEDGATLIAADGARADGRDAIRQSLERLFAIRPTFTSTDGELVVTGDLALMSNRWSISISIDGELSDPFHGESTEIARRQTDGSWRYVLDIPLRPDWTHRQR